MFWGLILKANRKYTQSVGKDFHISQAALDSSTSQGGSTQIYLSYDDQKYLLCTLRKDVCEQVKLDLNFSEDEKISFQSQGSGVVTLSGYLLTNEFDGYDPNDDSDEGVDEDVSMAEMADGIDKKFLKAQKRNENVAEYNGGVATGGDESDSDDDHSEDEDEDEDEDGDGDDDDIGEEEEEDLEEEVEGDESEEEVQPPPTKQPKIEKQQKVKQQSSQNGVEKPTVEKKKEKKGKNDAPQKNQQKQQPCAPAVEKTLSGGIKIKDLQEGKGAEAKNGKKVTVYYEGRLKSNNKMFDSIKQGAGFKFCMGRCEVIKGWDIGLTGMKVGGKRRITCPPHMAYGARGSPPTIPPNSTLIFDIELKNVV